MGYAAPSISRFQYFHRFTEGQLSDCSTLNARTGFALDNFDFAPALVLR